ncbi:MAG: MFS transporter [Thermodesulfobacteriota bacterium]|nr:MFS transporter [Thermodesulfobacteriota bacterium]
MAEKDTEKLSLTTKIGFGVGDIYGGGAMVIIGFYYLYFLTDVVRINPALAGIVFLISKMWDAISDPLMGLISDRTRTKMGRRRPYFLAGIILIFLSFFMMWYPVDFDKEIHRFVFVFVAYIFFSTTITMVMVPYNALSSELTLDYNERSSLSSIRIFFSTLSSMVCAVVPLEIVKRFPDARDGYITMAVSIGLFFSLPYIATFLTTKEREEFQVEKQPFSIKMGLTSFIEPFKIRSFVNVLMMYLFAFLTMDMLMTIVIYFMTYYLERGNETNYVLGTLLLFQIISIPFYYYLSKKTSKRAAFMLGVALWIGIMLFSYLITPEMHPYAMYIFGGLVGFATGGVVVMIYSIFPDIPDIDELYSGQRREGIYFGLVTFMRKVSSALAIFFISNAIALAGYKAPIEETIDGVTKMVQQGQSTELILTLRVLFSVVPIILLLVCLYNCIRYPLTPGLHARLRKILGVKREKTDLTDELKIEEKELKKILIRG